MNKTSRSYRKPYKIKKKKSILKNKYLWLFVLAFFIFLGCFYMICFSPWVQIKTINISGNEYLSNEEISGVAEEQIETKMLFVNTRSTFLISVKKIQANLLEAFPKIDSVKIKRKFFNELDVSIKEKGPSAVFCRKDNCFFIDSQGVVFEKKDAWDNTIVIIDTVKENISLKEQVIEKEYLDNILKIDRVLKTDLFLDVETYSLLPDRMTVKLKEGWFIFFKISEEVDWQLDKLKTVLDKEIADRSSLEYIELRFGNLAPYK